MMPVSSPMPADGAHFADLLQAIASRRDRKAFATLFAFYAPRLKTYMRRRGASEAAAEELAQETMLAVWRKAETFDGSRKGVSAWIFTIGRNVRIDALRRDKIGTPVDIATLAEAEQPEDQAPHPDSAVATAQEEGRVRAALAQLPDEQRAVVELSFFDEQAHGEIAAGLAIPLGTVKSRLRLAMKRLRTLLEDAS